MCWWPTSPASPASEPSAGAPGELIGTPSCLALAARRFCPLLSFAIVLVRRALLKLPQRLGDLGAGALCLEPFLKTPGRVLAPAESHAHPFRFPLRDHCRHPGPSGICDEPRDDVEHERVHVLLTDPRARAGVVLVVGSHPDSANLLCQRHHGVVIEAAPVVDLPRQDEKIDGRQLDRKSTRLN